MKKIIICLNPFESHFLSMMNFIKNLEESGFWVLLIGDSCLKKIVENKDLKFISLSTFLEKEIQSMKKIRNISKWRFYIRIAKRRYMAYSMNIDLIIF